MTLTLVPQMPPAAVVPTGAPSGGLNCNAAAGAVCVIHATDYIPTASEVRALCRNADGSLDTSGGLTLRQVADAIRRGYGVSMDVRTPDDYAAFRLRLADDPTLVASVAIWYGTLRNSPAYASRTGFIGNHQAVVRWVGGPLPWEMADSLADGLKGAPLGPVRISDALLRQAAGALVLNAHTGKTLGSGKVYVGYVKGPAAPKPTRFAVKFTPGSFFEYGVQGGVAITRSPHRFKRPTSAPCAAPESIAYPTAAAPTRQMVRVTAGVLKDSYVEPGRAHVSLVEG